MSEEKSEVKIMGIDLAHGSPQSKTHKPHYAVVLIDGNGRKLYEVMDIPLKRVIRLIWEYRPKLIALDNVFELASSERVLAKIMSLLPDDVELVQVTLVNGELLDIREVARRSGIEVPYTKLSPLQTAEVVARLALKGVGTKIRAIEQKTKIIVARGRSLGSGGSSAQRFKRGIRTAILRVVRKIKEELDEHGISYDLMFRRSEGGFDGAVFIVYAPRSALKGIVRPVRAKSVRVIIKPIYKSIITFGEAQRPLKKRYVIVGLDPGRETGLAVVDLVGTPLLLLSLKEFDRTSIITSIYNTGIPILVATDKHPVPDAVKKLASTLGIPVYDPGASLTTEEKDKLIEWLKNITGVHDIQIKSTHIRDALAACAKVLRVHERKFKEVEQKLLEMGLEIPIDEIRKEILEGKTIAEIIEKCIEKTIHDESHTTTVHVMTLSYHEEERYRKRIRQLEEKVMELTRERELLKENLKKLQSRVEELECIIEDRMRSFSREIETNREIEILKERLRQLSCYVNDLEHKMQEQSKVIGLVNTILLKLLRGEAIIMRRVKNLLRTSLQKALTDVNRDNPAIYVDNLGVLNGDVLELIRDGKVILVTSACGDFSSLENLGVGVVSCIEPLYVMDDVVVLDSHIIDQINQVRKRIEERRRKSEDLTLEKLISIIDEYRRDLLTKRGLDEHSSE